MASSDDLTIFLQKIDEIVDLSQFQELFNQLSNCYGLQSIAYLGVALSNQGSSEPYLAVTYPADWIDRYKAERFVDIDPAIQVGLRRMLPIDWNDFNMNNSKVRRLFGEASEFGLGRNGMSVPVHGRRGDRAVLLITSDMVGSEWQRRRLELMRDFQILALQLHQTMLRIVGGRVDVDVPTLSPRERECLLWTAQGKTSWECAVILGISERTVRFYLESARHKLGAANTIHAVTKAGMANLLSELP